MVDGVENKEQADRYLSGCIFKIPKATNPCVHVFVQT